MRNILFFISLSILLLSGCLPVSNDNGMSMTGYNKTDETLKLEMGSVGTRLMYENAVSEDPNRDFDRDLSRDGFLFGIFVEKKF